MISSAIDIYYEYVLKNLRSQYSNMGNNPVNLSADGAFQIHVGDNTPGIKLLIIQIMLIKLIF